MTATEISVALKVLLLKSNLMKTDRPVWEKLVYLIDKIDRQEEELKLVVSKNSTGWESLEEELYS